MIWTPLRESVLTTTKSRRSRRARAGCEILLRGLSLGMLDGMRARHHPKRAADFWRGHAGLVWSNSQADDGAHIRAALLRPRFGRLLEIAVEFGLPRVRAE